MNFSVILLVLGLLGSALAQAPADKKVKVSVFYESRCPDSHQFFLHQLGPTFTKLGSDIIDLELVAFGNANVTYNARDQPIVVCQHGPDECFGNRVEACAINQAATQKAGLDYVLCMFGQTNWADTHANVEKCAHAHNLDWGKISACNAGTEGDVLIVNNWVRTRELNPKKTFIPWILIDDTHSADEQKQVLAHLLTYLCQNYLKARNLPQCQ